MTIKLDSKAKFNALSNATHIFALKEEGTAFQLLDVINGEEDTKAVAVTKDGEVIGIFTDSKSAKTTLNDVFNCFGKEQPFITMHVKETKKGQSVYYAEVE
jgi:hypothetical protein